MHACNVLMHVNVVLGPLAALKTHKCFLWDGGTTQQRQGTVIFHRRAAVIF